MTPSSIVGLEDRDLPLSMNTYAHQVNPQPWIRFSTFVLNLLRPKVSPGLERLEWTCNCGREMYGDYAEHEVMMQTNLVQSLPNCRFARWSSGKYSLVSYITSSALMWLQGPF